MSPSDGKLLADRTDAGRRLAAALAPLRPERPVVLALPRGGVPVAYEVARALGVPLDVTIVRKLGAPAQPELGFGAIAEGGVAWINRPLCAQLGLTAEEIGRIAQREALEVERRARRFRGERPPIQVRGRTVILIDDGVATGGTARAAIRLLRARGPRRLVLAVPVAPPETAEELAREVDGWVCLETPPDFFAIGQFYDDFRQVSDEQVRALLERAQREEAAMADATKGGERAVTVAAGGVELEGTLALPDGAEGLVLFAHGSGSSRFSPRNRRVARALGAGSLATLLVDLLTAEEEEIDRLTAELRFDIELLSARLIGAVDWLLRDPATRGLRIGLFGSSTGAAAALMAAAARPEAIGAVVSRGGRPDLAGGALGRVRCPTLFIVGGADREVLELNRAALAELGDGRDLQVVPGATHLFEEPGALERVARLALDWFRLNLAPRERPAHA
jgi:putative phosphoribosyl transferase